MTLDAQPAPVVRRGRKPRFDRKSPRVDPNAPARPGSPYVTDPNWQLDMTPVNRVINEEGLALLPERLRGVPVCQLSINYRRKVGLVREWTPDAYQIPGSPKGWVPAQVAYRVVQVLPWKDVQRLAKGHRPLTERWPKEREVTAQYVRVAQEVIAAGPRGVPQEINNRTDGCVAQRVETQSVSFVVEVPAVVSAEMWQAQARRELGSGEEL